MESKINQLLKQWPKNTLATASWLEKHELYRQLTMRYILMAGHESADQLLSWISARGRGDLGYKKGKVTS